jgi:hypothetical protein
MTEMTQHREILILQILTELDLRYVLIVRRSLLLVPDSSMALRLRCSSATS